MPYSDGGLSAGSFAMFLLGTIVVVALAYYVTYLVSKGATKGAQSKGIKILDSRALSKDKLICVIDVAGKAYLVAMSDGGTCLLDTLSPEAADQLRADGARMMPAFSGVIQKRLGKAFEAIAEKRRQPTKKDPSFAQLMKSSAEKEEAPSLQTAAEADDLDEMYRKLQKRREKKESPPQGGQEP